MQLYLDSILQQTLPIPAVNVANTNNLRVVRNSISQFSTNFDIDVTRIICKYITDAEVHKYCNKKPGCGAHWPFSENSLLTTINNDILGYNDLAVQVPPVFSNGILKLSGGYDVALGSSNIDLATNSQFTIMAWLKTKGLSFMPIVTKFDISGGTFAGY